MQLRDQLNFYMGDSNLVKDNFLRQKLSESTQLPISIFLGFNRVKAIFADERSVTVQTDLLQ
jgi:hypothetical protein